MKEETPILRASLLDRLLDFEPGVSHEPVQKRFVGTKAIMSSVIRDLENLLNTRRRIFLPPITYKEVNGSLYIYGLGDFTARNPKSSLVGNRLRQEIEKTISRFEPRLRNVSVQIETHLENERSLRFRIVGLLVVDPIRESVAFDTYFDINRGVYSIRK